MSKFHVPAWILVIAGCVWSASAQNPEPGKHKTAVIQWAADLPLLTYDIRYTGGDSATMPPALKYFVKDLAESEGWYLTGEAKSKTVASHSKRILLDYTKAKSKLNAVRVAKVDVKELPHAVVCVVSFSKKPSQEDVTRTGGLLETFARKYLKAAKSAAANVDPVETTKANVWNYEVRLKDAARKELK